MAETSLIKPTIVLTAAPRLLYARWLIQLTEYLATLGVLYLGEGGLLEINFHLTDAEYALLPHVNDAAGNPIIPNIRPVYVRQEPAGNTAAVAAAKEHNGKVACVTAAIIQAKQFLIISAGDVAEELHDPVTGLARVSFHQLLQYIKSTYGTLLKADVDNLRAVLRIWSVSKTVKANLTQYSQIHLALSNAGFAMLELDKIAELDEATRSRVAVQEVFKLFRIEQPAVALQTYADLVAKIVLLEPTFTAEQAKYISANSAAAEALAAAAHSNTESLIKSALAAQEKVFQKRIDTLTAQIANVGMTRVKQPTSKERATLIAAGLCVKCFLSDKKSKWENCKLHNSNSN